MGSLHLTQCLKLTEVRISNAFQLKEINCRSCKLLQLLAVPTKTLETIQLSGCNALNLELLWNENNFLIQSLLSGNLKSLDLSQIHHITNGDIDQLLHFNHSLEALSVFECKLISNNKRKAIHKMFNRPTTKSNRARKRKQRVMDRKSRKYTD